MKEKSEKKKQALDQIINSNQYMLWLDNYTKITPFFTCYHFINFKDEIERDNILNLAILYNIINQYARKNYLYPKNNYYYIKYNNTGYQIGIDDKNNYFCQRIEIKPDFLNFKDIQQNKELPNTKLLKSYFQKLKEIVTLIANEDVPCQAVFEITEKTYQKMKK